MVQVFSKMVGPPNKKPTDRRDDSVGFFGPWHRDKQLFIPVLSRKLYRVAPTNGD
jgi:hypothetical protein